MMFVFKSDGGLGKDDGGKYKSEGNENDGTIHKVLLLIFGRRGDAFLIQILYFIQLNGERNASFLQK